MERSPDIVAVMVSVSVDGPYSYRVPYGMQVQRGSIVAVTKVRTAMLPMPLWAEFLDRHRTLKARFEYEVMKLMSEVMAHTITLHLLDAPGRLARFHRKHPDLAGRIPKKELAAYLNLTPETLSRLKKKIGTDPNFRSMSRSAKG